MAYFYDSNKFLKFKKLNQLRLRFLIRNYFTKSLLYFTKIIRRGFIRLFLVNSVITIYFLSVDLRLTTSPAVRKRSWTCSNLTQTIWLELLSSVFGWRYNDCGNPGDLYLINLQKFKTIFIRYLTEKLLAQHLRGCSFVCLNICRLKTFHFCEPKQRIWLHVGPMQCI